MKNKFFLETIKKINCKFIENKVKIWKTYDMAFNNSKQSHYIVIQIKKKRCFIKNKII